MITEAPTTRTRSNGAKHTIEVVELEKSERLATLETALGCYQQRDSLRKDEKYALGRVLAESGLFAYAHLAAILGTSVSTLKRHGAKVEGTRKGGVFDPAQLENVVHVLRTLEENSTYEVQRIRLAHEGGISAGVLGRFLGLSHTYVLKLVRMAQDDRSLEYADTHASRAGHRQSGVDARTAEYAASLGYTDLSELTAEERDVMARLAAGEFDFSEHLCDNDEVDSVDESGAVADEAGRDVGADHGAAGGDEDTGARPERHLPLGEQSI